MSNLFSLDIISLNFMFNINEQSENPWPFRTFLLIFLISLCSMIFLIYRRCCPRTRRRPIQPIRPITPQAFSFVILFFFIIPILALKKAKKPSSKAGKLAKSFSKRVPEFLLPPLLWLGLDSLAEFVKEEPEFASFLFATIGLLSFFALLLLIKTILSLIHFFKTKQPNPNPENPIEMRELRQPPNHQRM